MKRHTALALLPLSLLLIVFGANAAPAFGIETTLCKKAEEQCKNQYGKEPLELTVVKWELENTFGPVTCGQSTIKGKTTAQSGEPLPGEITAQELAKCEINIGGKKTLCGMSSAVNLPYTASLAWKAASMDGQWRWKSSGAGNPGFKFECGTVLNCTFTVTEPISELFGGAGASLALSKAGMKMAGTTCPATANWSGLWIVVTPSPLYVGFV